MRLTRLWVRRLPYPPTHPLIWFVRYGIGAGMVVAGVVLLVISPGGCPALTA